MQLGVYLLDQQLAGLDIVTDGDCRASHTDVGGKSETAMLHMREALDATMDGFAGVVDGRRQEEEWSGLGGGTCCKITWNSGCCGE